MTISEALISLNSFPIPASLIEKFGIERGLTISDDYTLAVSITQAYRLATADVHFWLYSQPSITEQEVGINHALAIKKGLLDFANAIYKEYEDDKYIGKGTFGFIGGSFNG